MQVKTAETELTFGVSRDQGILEWAGTSLSAVFAQRRNLLSPQVWRMLFDLVRFNQFALDVLISDDIETHRAASTSIKPTVRAEETIGQYLDREGYSDAFRDDYLVPMAAAVEGTSASGHPLDLPAVTLIRLLYVFCATSLLYHAAKTSCRWNHRRIPTVGSRTRWLTIRDGSKSYVDAVMRGFPSNHRFLNTAARAVTNDEDGRVRLHLENGRSEVYDHVVLAVGGDEAYLIVRGSATPEEKQILSRFRTTAATAVLHADVSLMPRRRKAWSSWNCLTQSSLKAGRRNIDQVSLTYNMNIIQHIPRDVFGDVLVTLDPVLDPDPKLVQGRYKYRRPLYDGSTIGAQQRLSRIQNTRGISYAGAWTRYGSQEDAFSSGLRVAQDHLGARLPFRLEESTFGRGNTPELGVADLALRLVILIVQVFFVKVIERTLEGYRAKTRRRSPFVNGLSATTLKKLR